MNSRPLRTPMWLLVIGLFPGAAPESFADELVLRNLKRIADCTVAGIDEDGVRLTAPSALGKSIVRWDEIESGKVTEGRQADFDKLLGEVGDDLFRVRWRLQVGDTDGLREPAERLYPRYKQRRSPSALLVCTATLWGRIAAGERESAVEPLLYTMEILRSGAAGVGDLPGARPLNIDIERGICPDLLPVWFDADQARKALPTIMAAVRSMSQPRPDGVRMYYGSLALLAGDRETGLQMLGETEPKDATVAQLRLVTLASHELAERKPGSHLSRLEEMRQSGVLAAEIAPAASYVAGMAKIATNDSEQLRDGALDLVAIAALYGQTNRELAAAGLYQAAQALDKLKDAAGAEQVRRELRLRFAGTIHAAKLE